MKGLLHVGAGLLLMTALGIAAQKSEPKPPKPAPAPRASAPAAKSPAPAASGIKNPEAPKGPKAGGARLGAPGNPVERLMAMPPEQRERVLEKLPASQQANLRQRLERFDKLPAAERERLNRMWNTFNNLPPEKQSLVRRQIQAFNSLPDDRQEALAPVLQRLRRMPEDERHALLGSEEFKSKYSASEWQMLSDISQNLPILGR
jgi:hypothetical protein